MFKSALVYSAVNALGDLFLNVVCHKWPEKVASKRITHSTLTLVLGDGSVVCQVQDTFVH